MRGGVKDRLELFRKFIRFGRERRPLAGNSIPPWIWDFTSVRTYVTWLWDKSSLIVHKCPHKVITLSILSNLSRTSLIKIKMPNKMFPCVGHHSLRNVRADWALAAPLAHILLDWRQIWQKIKSMQGFAGPRYIWKYHFVFHAERITQELQQTAPPANGTDRRNKSKL